MYIFYFHAYKEFGHVFGKWILLPNLTMHTQIQNVKVEIPKKRFDWCMSIFSVWFWDFKKFQGRFRKFHPFPWIQSHHLWIRLQWKSPCSVLSSGKGGISKHWQRVVLSIGPVVFVQPTTWIWSARPIADVHRTPEKLNNHLFFQWCVDLFLSIRKQEIVMIKR